MRIWRFALVAALLTAGCDSNTAPAANNGPVTIDFGGILAPQGTAFRPVTINTAGKISAKLVSLTAGTTFSTASAPAGTTIGVGIGVTNADATVCTVTTSMIVGPSLTTQLTADVVPGASCVQVFDPGTLTGSVLYAVRFVVS